MTGRTLRSSIKPPQDEAEHVDSDSDASDASESESASEGDESETDAITPTTDSKGKGKEGELSSAMFARRARKQPRLEEPSDEPASDDDEPDESEASEEDEPIKKKPTQKMGGKVGGLQRLNDMPLEIVSEICTHLNCTDLVRLSLSSRPIREVLLDPTSTVIWASARRAAGLPDLTSPNMNEIQYAQLVFLDSCQGCGRARVPQADYCLRKRMCKPCRKTNWLKLNAMWGKAFHPQTRVCVALTAATPAHYGRGWNEPRYACVSDANIISAKLFELEAEDREINAANAANVKAPKAESKSKAKPQLQPHRKATTSKAVVKAAPAQTRAVVAVVETKGTKSSLLADYVDKRKILVAKMLVDGKAMHAAVVDLKATARNVRITENQKSRGLGFQRSDAIRLKCEALGWDYRDFVGTWNTSTYINKAELLTDEIWESVKSNVLKILEKNKAARLVADAALVTKQRQSRLRVAHQTLRAAEPDADKRSSFPIFGDFLNLPSVVPFWEPIDATFVQIQWDAVVSDIQLEVTEHRESTRIHAIKQILLSTTDASEEDLDDYDTSYDAATHGDQFFSTATSFLFCTLPNCRHKPRHRYRWYGYGGMSHNPSRTTFFGSLPDILAHQHELHGDQRFDDPSDGHFELPEILADVLASLADAINVERDEVLPKDLDGYYYKWTSATSKPGKYWEWRDLIDEIHHKLGELKGKKTLAPVEVEVVKKKR